MRNHQIKPGTVCLLLPASSASIDDGLAGCVVVARRPDPRASNYWLVSPPVFAHLPTVCMTPIGESIGPGKVALSSFHSARLQPLDDPGEDATDEMVQRLGSPLLQEVPQQ